MSGGPGGLTVDGWRLYFADGTTASSLYTDWRRCPNDKVQVFNVYYKETYTVWEGDELKEYPYRDVHCLKDYYWLYGSGSSYEAAGHVTEVGDIKTGSLLPDEMWWEIYNRALGDMVLF